MSVTVKHFEFNAFQENTYVIYDQHKNAIVVDPGCYTRKEQQELSTFLKEEGLTLHAILGTHAHIDHVLGNDFIMRTYGVDYYLHSQDVATLSVVSSYAHLYGFDAYMPSDLPTHTLNGGEQLSFGDIHFEVYHTPGHAPGHVVYYNRENNFVINGDVLFNGSFGRVDLPGGDLETLKDSIFNTMFKLPEQTVVYCGHGPATTIGKEKRTNYILNF